MAMEKQCVIRDVHTRSVTALGYNPSRREFMVGCEGLFSFVTHSEMVGFDGWTLMKPEA